MSGERQSALDANFKKGAARGTVVIEEEKGSFLENLTGFFAQQKRGNAGIDCMCTTIDL